MFRNVKALGLKDQANHPRGPRHPPRWLGDSARWCLLCHHSLAGMSRRGRNNIPASGPARRISSDCLCLRCKGMGAEQRGRDQLVLSATGAGRSDRGARATQVPAHPISEQQLPIPSGRNKPKTVEQL